MLTMSSHCLLALMVADENLAVDPDTDDHVNMSHFSLVVSRFSLCFDSFYYDVSMCRSL